MPPGWEGVWVTHAVARQTCVLWGPSRDAESGAWEQDQMPRCLASVDTWMHPWCQVVLILGWPRCPCECAPWEVHCLQPQGPACCVPLCWGLGTQKGLCQPRSWTRPLGSVGPEQLRLGESRTMAWTDERGVGLPGLLPQKEQGVLGRLPGGDDGEEPCRGVLSGACAPTVTHTGGSRYPPCLSECPWVGWPGPQLSPHLQVGGPHGLLPSAGLAV